MDDRTLHETYLWPFSEGVRAGVAAVMCSYNMVFKAELARYWVNIFTQVLDQRDLRVPEQQTSQWNFERRVGFPGLCHGWCDSVATYGLMFSS